MDQSTEDQVLKAYERAPKAVQDALTDGPVIDFMMGLQANYHLHIDTAGSISGMIRDMLLGLLTPSDFYSRLSKLGIDSSDAQKLTQELNEKVFTPLRDYMRDTGKKGVQEVSTENPTVSTVKKPLIETPSVEIKRPVPVIAQATNEIENSATRGTESVVIPQQSPIVVTQEPSHPGAVQTSNPNRGNWHPAAAVHIYVPSPLIHPEANTPITPSVKVEEAKSSQNLPASIASSTHQESAFIKAIEPTPEKAPEIVIKKEFGADPYREPI